MYSIVEWKTKQFPAMFSPPFIFDSAWNRRKQIKLNEINFKTKEFYKAFEEEVYGYVRMFG